ncbi:MAG: hypothetical protein ACP5RS_06390 [Thermoplasmata archaeon]
MGTEKNIKIDFRIGNYMNFKTDLLNDVSGWMVDNIFQKIWLLEEFQTCAKGGNEKEAYSKYKDMDYLAHILSGIGMALKVLDYDYYKNGVKDEGLEKNKLKRAILGYIFHDYNKITKEDYKMENSEPLFKFIDKLPIKEILSEVELSKEDIYQIAISTERGTQYNILNDDIKTSNLIYESNFSRLADILSSTYNKEDQGEFIYNIDIYFGAHPIIQGKKIKRVVFSNTNLLAITDILKKAYYKFIDDLPNNFFYLWSTGRAIYFISEDGSTIEYNAVIPKFSELVSDIMKPEESLDFNDRRINNSASGNIEHTKESIKNFVSDNKKMKNCIWLENIKINDNNRENAEKLGDIINNMNLFFTISYRTLKEKKNMSLRDGLNIKEYDVSQDEQRERAFAARYVQLLSNFNTDESRKLRNELSKALNEHKDILDGLLGKNEEHSALLIPFVIKSDQIDWNKLIDDIIKKLNEKIKKVDYSKILSKIVIKGALDEDLPDVPDKSDMSMINGYPANDKAIGENLFGINTNTFNNRLRTSGISNGKIDEISELEFYLRKCIIPLSNKNRDKEGLFYLIFPGAIPYIDIPSLLEKLSIKNEEKGEELRDLYLAIDESLKISDIRRDNAFFYSINELKTDEDILKNLYQGLLIYLKTKMLVRISFSNAPLLSDQFEAIRIEVGNSFCSSMGWEKIRCNEVKKVKDEILTFNCIANGSTNKISYKDTSLVIKDYVQNTWTIFHHIHKKNLENKNGYKLSKDFLQRIDKIRQLAYNTNKKGERDMKNIMDLANSAAIIQRPKWNMSGSERTWIIRDSLEAIEKARSTVKDGDKKDISEFKEFAEGVIYKTIERTKGPNEKMPKESDIKDFVEKLIKLLKEDFDGKIPAGSMKAYLIDAFEFEYMVLKDKR